MYSYEERMKAENFTSNMIFAPRILFVNWDTQIVRCWCDGIRNTRKQVACIGSIRRSVDTHPNKCRLPWIIILTMDAVSAQWDEYLKARHCDREQHFLERVAASSCSEVCCGS